jgi:hypothetical protein
MAGRFFMAAIFVVVALFMARLIWRGVRSGRVYLRPVLSAERSSRPIAFWLGIVLLAWGVLWGFGGAALILLFGQNSN